MYDHLSISKITTQIRLSTMYFNSTEGAAALLSNYAAAFSDTMQQPWRSLSSPRTSCLLFFLANEISDIIRSTE